MVKPSTLPNSGDLNVSELSRKINDLQTNVNSLEEEVRSKKFKTSYELINTKNFVTMNMGFNKNLFNNYENFFDNRFSYYGFEDFELAYRLKKKGIFIELIKEQVKACGLTTGRRIRL